MKLKRKKVNSEIVKDINAYWTEEKKAYLQWAIRKAIFIEVGKFEKIEEPKVQQWAHKMVHGDGLIEHADRQDIKAATRKFMRKQVIIQLGMQKFFPEIFEVYNDKEKDNDV
jgi:hypothetical protein